MNKIKFDLVKKEILEIIPSASLDNWDLIPDSIHQLATTEGIVLEWKRIPEWIDFEEGRVNYEEGEFLNLAFYKHKPQGQIYLVTDNCFKKGEAYSVASVNLLNFVRDMDQLDDENSFVQPLDYVFVNPEQKLVTLIHHEGQVAQYKKMDLTSTHKE